MRVWNLYTPCQCIRHLTMRWIEIDSKATMTKRRLPNHSESVKKKPFLFSGLKPGSIFGDSLTNDVDDVISFLKRRDEKRKNQFTDFYRWCLLFHFNFMSRRVVSFSFFINFNGHFSDHSRAPSIFMICLFVVIWLTRIFVTPFSTSNYCSAILIHLTIVIRHIRLIQWIEMFIVQCFEKKKKDLKT